MHNDQSFETANSTVEMFQRHLDVLGLQDDANRLRCLEIVDEESARLALDIITRMPPHEHRQIKEWRHIASQTLRYALRPKRAAQAAA